MKARRRTRIPVCKDWPPVPKASSDTCSEDWCLGEWSNELAFEGVLGLASLMSTSECDLPKDWVQRYPVLHPNESNLPTGVPLTAQKLLRDSYQVYFNSPINS